MTDVIIDTDVALGVWHEGRPRDIDDGFAIVEAINSPLINLRGISCVYGNGPIDEVVRVAREIVTLKQSNVPVARGASSKMAVDDATNEAVEFLAAELSRAPATIAAIGPLTNIGILLSRHPEVRENIDEIIIVAGRSMGAEFYIGDAGPVKDFNFENDVDACEILMNAGVPLVLMGFELTSQVCVTHEDLETIRRRANPTAQYFYDNSRAWCDYWIDTFPSDAGFHPWDSAAIAWVLNRSWFVSESRGHRISRDPDRLECSAEWDGPQHQYCYGFSDGAGDAFVRGVIEQVF